MLCILVAARGIEAIVGPASTIVEMIGHRALPLLNSFIAIALWIGLALWLMPGHGALGMAIAVAVAVVASTYAATLELQIADGLSPVRPQALPGSRHRAGRRRPDGGRRMAVRRPRPLRRL